MPQFAHDDVKPFDQQRSKKEQVNLMFDGIARRYDLVNRFLSLGIDISWRKKAIRMLAHPAPHHILDMATGTGDMAIMAARMLHPEKITGVDLSEGMLAIGREKVRNAQLENVIQLERGDSETIKYDENTFDAVMVAFGVRNFENLQQGLTEIRRVLKPGGRLVVLEFTKPVLPIVKQIYGFYMEKAAPQIAKWLKQDKKAYQYLNESARKFPDRERFDAILRQTGFSDTKWKPLSLGICCIYSGVKS